MATHSSVLTWRIPGMGEPGGLPSGVTQSRTQLKRLSSSSRCNSEDYYLQSSAASNIKPCWPSKPGVLGAHLTDAGLLGWGA